MRFRDWYFQGWERDTKTGKRHAYVYTGEYYSISGGIKPARRITLPLAAALIVLFLAVALLPSPGGMWHIAAIPQLLEIIPLIYLAIGGVCLLCAKEPMTYRDYHASWRRMCRAALWSTGFTACMAAAELVYLALNGREAELGRELPYLLGQAGCVALSALLFTAIKRRPCDPIPPQRKKSESHAEPEA